jgi:hypothetical protein
MGKGDGNELKKRQRATGMGEKRLAWPRGEKGQHNSFTPFPGCRF